jgi:hypothetical protein
MRGRILIAMKRFLAMGFALAASAGLLAQDATHLAAQREAEERDRRMSSAMEELRQANLVQQRRINELITENGRLQRQVTDIENRFRNSQVGAVTRDDLRKVYDKMSEIEKARQADKAVIIEQINKIAELAAKAPKVIEVPAPVPSPKIESKPPKSEPKPEKEPEAGPPDNPGGYYTYTVKSGDRLMAVIKAYNDELKDKNKKPITLDQVRKANPKINPNNLQVGKEILIPVPPDK